MLYTYRKNGTLEAAQSKIKVLYIIKFPFCIRVSSNQENQLLWTESHINKSLELRMATRVYMHVNVFPKQTWMYMTIHSERLRVCILQEWKLFTFLVVEGKMQVMYIKCIYRRKIYVLGKRHFQVFIFVAFMFNNSLSYKTSGSLFYEGVALSSYSLWLYSITFVRCERRHRVIMPRLNLSYASRSPLHNTQLKVQWQHQSSVVLSKP